MRAATLAAVLCTLACVHSAPCLARGAHTPTPHGAATYMARYSTTPHAHRANTGSYSRASHIVALRGCNPFAGVRATQSLNACG